MFDKMKQLMDMQKKAQELKRQLDTTFFDVSSPDGMVKITMSGSQEVKEVILQDGFQSSEKSSLEKSIKEAYNRGIKRCHEIASQKMKEVTGFSLPGL